MASAWCSHMLLQGFHLENDVNSCLIFPIQPGSISAATQQLDICKPALFPSLQKIVCYAGCREDGDERGDAPANAALPCLRAHKLGPRLLDLRARNVLLFAEVGQEGV